jgi:hypothetical protein
MQQEREKEEMRLIVKNQKLVDDIMKKVMKETNEKFKKDKDHHKK